MSLTRIINSLGLQQFQLGIITEDSLGQVSQLVVAQVPIKITLEKCKVHAEYNRYFTIKMTPKHLIFSLSKLQGNI